MAPSKSLSRNGIVAASALSLLILTGAPAFAAEGDATPQVGDACFTETLPDGLSCVLNQVVATPVDVPTETPSPSPSADVPVVTLPTTAPTAAPTSDPSSTPSTTPASPSGGDTSTGGSNAGGGATTGAGDTGKTSGKTSTTTDSPATSLLAASKAAAGTDTTPIKATSMLQSVQVASGGGNTFPAYASNLPALATSTGSTSASVPSPLLANLPAATSLASVQAPLIAAGDDSAGSGGITLAGLNGNALPGLVVVLATALVAAVGAGNVRAWQNHIASRGRR